MERAEAREAVEVWREPVRGGYPDPRLMAWPGRRRLECWRRGIMPPPPLRHLTGAMPTGFGTGTAEAKMPASPWLASSSGLISGGALAILADIAFGLSIETELPPATPYTTAELSLSFLRPARIGATLLAGGQAIHVGRSVGLSEVFVIDEESDRLIAHGTSRLTIFPPLEQVPDPPETIEPYAAPAARVPGSLPATAAGRGDPAGGVGGALRRGDPHAPARRRATRAPPSPPHRPPAHGVRRGHGHLRHAPNRVAREPVPEAPGRHDRDAGRLRDAGCGRDDRARRGSPSRAST